MNSETYPPPHQNPARRGPAYANLPIFRAASELALAVERAVVAMSRRHKYGLGDDLRRQAIGLLTDVARANRRANRQDVLERMCDSAETLKILLEHGRRLEAFSGFAQYADLAQRTVEVARQAEGWRRHGVSGPERPRTSPAREDP